MLSRQLYINNQLTDLPDSVPVAISFQVNDIGTIKDRQAGYSNTIKLPLTKQNLAIYGYPDVNAFTQNQPYQIIPARYIENGVEIVSKGQVILNNLTDSIEADLTFGISSFADLTDGKNLSDIDLIPYGVPIPTDFATIVASQTKTSGFIWPVIDYGQLQNNSIIDTRYLRPAWFTHTIIEAIGTFTGYTFFGAIFSDPQFLSEIIPFSNDDYKNQTNPATDLPNISIKDFLKDFMQAYFLTPVIDNVAKTIVFRSFDELYRDRSRAKDWTDKFVKGKNTTGFKFNDYAQTNNLLYADDEAVNIDRSINKNQPAYLEATQIGNTSFPVNNTTLSVLKNLITRPFAATLMSDYIYPGTQPPFTVAIGGQYVAQIKKIPDFSKAQDFETSVKPRILYNRIITSSYQFTDGQQTVPVNSLSVPYFTYQGKKGLAWAEMVSRYGQGYMKLISRARVETREIQLKTTDIYNFDHFIPVFDRLTGVYYYVNKIDGYQNGKTCKVGLVRM